MARPVTRGALTAPVAAPTVAAGEDAAGACGAYEERTLSVTGSTTGHATAAAAIRGAPAPSSATCVTGSRKLGRTGTGYRRRLLDVLVAPTFPAFDAVGAFDGDERAVAEAVRAGPGVRQEAAGGPRDTTACTADPCSPPPRGPGPAPSFCRYQSLEGRTSDVALVVE